MSTQTKKRFTFDRRKLTIDPVPTILYYKDTDTNINDAIVNSVKLNYDPQNYSIPCQCSLCVRKREVVVSDNKLIPLSVTMLEINLKK